MRIQCLDGVRGLAIALVIAFHELHFVYGWVGVDIFFTLSGYLVTTILRRNREDASFWGPFYLKRATRILPPFLIALTICAIFYHPEWVRMRYWYLTTLANFGLIPTQGGSAAFGMFWSLSVEEHFYLAWPFAIRFLRAKTLVRVLAAVLVLEPILRAVVTPHTHGYWVTYALTPFRLDGLAAGALLAVLMEERPDWLLPWAKRLSFACLAGIVALIATHHFTPKQNDLLFNAIGYSLTALAAVTLFAYLLLRESSWLKRTFELRPLVWLGSISYGVYLYERPIFFGFGHLAESHGWRHHAVLFPLALPVVLLAAWLSFVLIEKRTVAFGQRMAAAVRDRAALRAANTRLEQESLLSATE